MSEGNGEVIVIGKKGKRKFQYDADTPVVEVDVIHLSNRWVEIVDTFRDDKGEIIKDKTADYNKMAYDFAVEVLQAPDMSLADALHFHKLLIDEANKLKGFFAPESPDGPSSRANLDVRYST